MKSSIIKDRIKFYEDNRKRIIAGDHNYVPFYGFDRLCRYVPGVVPGIMYKVTSHMGVGKTQLAKFLFVYQTMLYAIKHNINFKVIYFALEESKEEFIDSLFLHLMRRIEKQHVDRFALTGFSQKAVDQAKIEALRRVEKAMAKLISNIEVIDNKYEPTKMLEVCKGYAKKWGTFIQNADGTEQYVPNDSKQITLVVTDHISLLEPEFNDKSKTFMSDRQTIARWHTHYCRRILAKEWNWAVLNIQQQALDSAKEQYNYKGTSIIDKLIPSLEGLANNKEVGRDDYVTLGLFSPAMFNVSQFKGYDIYNGTPEDFGDRLRTIHLLKNRFGEPNKTLPVYFDGRYTYFKELPRPGSTGLNYFYKLLKT